MRTWLIGGASAVCLILASASAASAQQLGGIFDQNTSTVTAGSYFDDQALRTGLFTRDRNIGVRERPRPDYAALPLHVGQFFVSPSIQGEVEQNDNIYAVETGKQSDTIFRLKPSASLTSNWSNHQVTAFASASINGYSSNSTENTTDYVVGTNDRLDIQRDFALTAGASFGHLTQSRTSAGTPISSKEPLRYDQGLAYIGLIRSLNRLRGAAWVSYEHLDFDNGVDFNNNLVYQDDRDRDLVLGGLRGEYAVNPDTSVFAKLTTNTRNFPHHLVGEAPRDSSGYDLTAGASFDLTALIRGEVAVGYLSQSYDNSAYGDVSGPSVHAKVEYYPTQLITVTATADRSVEDAAVVGAGGYLATNLSLQGDYELLRNLILTANAAYSNDDYQGNFDRTDKRSLIGLGGIYLVNRAINLSLTYQNYHQSSSGLDRGPRYSVNRLLLALRYNF